jgi:hypothetical protein
MRRIRFVCRRVYLEVQNQECNSSALNVRYILPQNWMCEVHVIQVRDYDYSVRSSTDVHSVQLASLQNSEYDSLPPNLSQPMHLQS